MITPEMLQVWTSLCCEHEPEELPEKEIWNSGEKELFVFTP